MRVIKSINNNVALAIDEAGREVVVFGKGVGFHAVPYELDDPSLVQKRFYEISPTLLPMVETLSEDVLLASTEIVDLARERLGCELNPNLAFTLADHIQFAKQCAVDGVTLENPLAAEIAVVYPRETAIGRDGTDIVKRRCTVELPATEACAIALHIVNAEAPASLGSSMDLVMKSTRIIDEIISLVECRLSTTIDRDSYAYTRFVTHLRFLISRLRTPKDQPLPTGAATIELLPTLEQSYPKAASCARSISDYLRDAHGWECSDEERLYLLLHTNQFITGQ